VRPGEKTHEIMVSEEEISRTELRGNSYVILPVLPELRGAQALTPSLQDEYSSESSLMSRAELETYLKDHQLLVDDAESGQEELLR
jgi:UDP-glucose 4-epimerase